MCTSVNYLIVQFRGAGAIPIGREFPTHPIAASGAEFASRGLREVGEAGHGFGEHFSVTRLDQNSGFVVKDQFRNSADPGAADGRSERIGFKEAASRVLVPSGR